MIVCRLVEWGEAKVSTLAEGVGLSQSAFRSTLQNCESKTSSRPGVKAKRYGTGWLIPDT